MSNQPTGRMEAWHTVAPLGPPPWTIWWLLLLGGPVASQKETAGSSLPPNPTQCTMFPNTTEAV